MRSDGDSFYSSGILKFIEFILHDANIMIQRLCAPNLDK
jgi:hypothetical protein